jgi:hypothetical protein
MTTVMFNRAADRYIVEFPYDRLVVEVVKNTVPSYARSWNKAAKQWVIDSEWAVPLATALRRTGCLVCGIDENPSNSPCQSWAASLFRAVGQRRIPAVHRALTRVLHPDNTDTGDTELQRQLNDARSEALCGIPHNTSYDD